MDRATAIITLGLPVLFDDEQLKRSWRRAVKQYHPDNGETPDVVKFIDCKDAHELLKKDAFKFAGVIKRGQRKNETAYQSEWIAALQGVGGFVFNVHGHMMQRSGMPDLQINHIRWFGYVELKVYEREVEPLQQSTMEKLNRCGTPAFVARWDGDTTLFQWKDDTVMTVDWRSQERGIRMMTAMEQMRAWLRDAKVLHGVLKIN